MTGPELKAYRMSKGWTQPQAAEKFGYSLRGWQRAEEKGPTPRLVLAIERLEARK